MDATSLRRDRRDQEVPVTGPEPELAGRVALVTGAAGGIGTEVVRLFLRSGAAVLATDVDAAAGKSLVEELDSNGPLEFAVADVTDEAEVAHVVETAVERFGRLDFAHNN